MGYRSVISGEIVIKPALSDAEVKGLGLSNDDEDMSCIIVVNEVNEDVAIVDGELTVVGDSLSRITPRYDEEIKAYSLEEEVRRALEFAWNGGRRASGFLVVDGEESDDLWRIGVLKKEEGTCVDDLGLERARMIWDDGTPVA